MTSENKRIGTEIVRVHQFSHFKRMRSYFGTIMNSSLIRLNGIFKLFPILFACTLIRLDLHNWNVNFERFFKNFS